jgi:hypothetical protein
MKTLHGRCAGLDVHKVEVVACMRLVEKGKVARQVRRFPTTTPGLLGSGGLKVVDARTWPWERRAYIGSRSGTSSMGILCLFWRMPCM